MAPSRRIVVLLAVIGVLTTGCGAGPETIGPTGVDGLQIPTPSPDPADFVRGIDNPWLPLVPGNEWVYASEGETPDTVTVTVTEETRVVEGVTTTAVRDVVTGIEGEVVEETLGWFAQDRDGNVWSFGEDITAYDEQGRAESDGSWEAGVDDARAGLVMAATPRVGDGYEEESDPGNAEDRVVVVALDDEREVAGTAYADLLVLEGTTPLEPGLVKRRYYARGTGLVYEETIRGATEQVELVSFSQG